MDLTPQLKTIIADMVFQLAALQAENSALRAELEAARNAPKKAATRGGEK